MKGISIGIVCALIAPFALAQMERPLSTQPITADHQTTTEQSATTTETASGTVTTYEPGKTIVVKEQTGNPVTYAFGKTVHYVDKAGREIDRHVIQPGKRVIVHFTGAGDHRTVERVEVED